MMVTEGKRSGDDLKSLEIVSHFEPKPHHTLCSPIGTDTTPATLPSPTEVVPFCTGAAAQSSAPDFYDDELEDLKMTVRDSIYADDRQTRKQLDSGLYALDVLVERIRMYREFAEKVKSSIAGIVRRDGGSV